MHLPWLNPFVEILRPSGKKSPSQLREPPAPERRLEELVDTREELGRERVGRGTEGRLDLVERLQLAEELHVAEPHPARQHLTNPVDLASERLDPNADSAHAPGLGMVAVVGFGHGSDDRFENV